MGWVEAVGWAGRVVLGRRVVGVHVSDGTLVATAALTVGLALDADAVFHLVGRDASLTGRTAIWAPLWERLSTRPWTGFGYGAFWHDPEGQIGRASGRERGGRYV